jgi:hypothetical protein
MSKNKELKAEEFFLEGYACSQAVLMAFADEIGLDMDTAKIIYSKLVKDATNMLIETLDEKQ